TLTINWQFRSESYGMEAFEFSDGTVWNRDTIAANSFIVGTPGDDTIDGTNTADNILGLAGNDMLRGGHGDDVYEFSAGDGQDTINDARFFNDTTVVNTVRLTDTDLADLRIELVNAGGYISDILLRYGATDSILIDNGFAS